jgi:hypothetical protein
MLIAGIRKWQQRSLPRVKFSQPYVDQVAEWELSSSEVEDSDCSSVFEAVGSVVPDCLRRQISFVLQTFVSPIQPYVAKLPGGLGAFVPCDSF